MFKILRIFVLCGLSEYLLANGSYFSTKIEGQKSILLSYSLNNYALLENGDIAIYDYSHQKIGQISKNQFEGSLVTVVDSETGIPYSIGAATLSKDGKKIAFSSVYDYKTGDRLLDVKYITYVADLPVTTANPVKEIMRSKKVVSVNNSQRIFIEQIKPKPMLHKTLTYLNALAVNEGTSISNQGTFVFNNSLLSLALQARYDNLILTDNIVVDDADRLYTDLYHLNQSHSIVRVDKNNKRDTIITSRQNVGPWDFTQDIYNGTIFASLEFDLYRTDLWEIYPASSPRKIDMSPVVIQGQQTGKVWANNIRYFLYSYDPFPKYSFGKMGVVDPLSGKTLPLLSYSDISTESNSGFEDNLVPYDKGCKILAKSMLKKDTFLIEPVIIVEQKFLNNVGSLKGCFNGSNLKVIANGVSILPEDIISIEKAVDGYDSVTFVIRNSGSTAYRVSVEKNILTKQSVNEASINLPKPKPSITAAGNAAEISVPLSPGGLGTILGENFSDFTFEPRQLFNGQEYIKEANGVSVIIDGSRCPLLYVSPKQINFQVPLELGAPTEVDIEVVHTGKTSDKHRARILPKAISAFKHNGYTIITNEEYKLVSTGPETTPAPANGWISIWLTGSGISVPNLETGKVSPANPLSMPFEKIRIQFGTEPEQEASCFMAPLIIGVTQCNILVPSPSEPNGEEVSILLLRQGGELLNIPVRIK